VRRVVVTGATGLIGRALVTELRARGEHVVALSRDEQRARRQLGAEVEVVTWADPLSMPLPEAALAGSDSVIHLLGEPIAQRWSDDVKRRIRDSRVLGTRNVVAGLLKVAEAQRPKILVSQSAVGYYGPRGEEELTEAAPPGNDFVAEVVEAWEAEAQAAEDMGLRVVLTRTGVVLDAHGGALAKMLPPFRAGIGGPVGSGRQYLPWIHLDDVVGALLFCLDHDTASGPVNLSAPRPVTNRDFSRALGRALHRPAFMPVPPVALKLLYGEMAEIVLEGQRAVPARLLELGYGFRHPDLDAALRDALAA
jgi:uncharacterized protein (TIGR01777 family)